MADNELEEGINAVDLSKDSEGDDREVVLSEGKEGNRKFQEDKQMVDVSEDGEVNREFQEDAISVVDLSKDDEEEINATQSLVQPQQKYVEILDLPHHSLRIDPNVWEMEFALMTDTDIEEELAARLKKIDTHARNMYHLWKNDVFSTYDEMMKRKKSAPGAKEDNQQAEEWLANMYKIFGDNMDDFRGMTHNENIRAAVDNIGRVNFNPSETAAKNPQTSKEGSSSSNEPSQFTFNVGNGTVIINICSVEEAGPRMDDTLPLKKRGRKE